MSSINVTNIKHPSSASNNIVLDSSGRVLAGASTARTNLRYGVTSYTPQYQFSGSDQTNTMFSLTRTDGLFGPVQFFATGSTGSAPTASGTNLGVISFNGFDGTNYLPAACIEAQLDATASASDMPGRIVLSTTSDGASSPTERMRIANTGFLSTFSTGNGTMNSVTAGAGTSTWINIGNRSATDNVNFGTTVWTVWSNGNAQNTNGSYTAISDAKLKENIADASSQWDDLKAIRICSWNFKEETGYETHRQIGPIAQELEQVCPGLVFETPDRDENGTETGEVTKGVNQSVLYMKAVKALQEAMERIETLEAKVAALEAA